MPGGRAAAGRSTSMTRSDSTPRAGHPPEEWPGLDWGDQGLQRLAKLRQLREQGVDPYPARFERSATPAEAIAAYEAWEAAHPEAVGTQERSPEVVRVAG